MLKTTYQYLRDNHEDFGVSKGAVQHWYRVGAVPIEHAINIERITKGEYLAQCLSGGYKHTHSQHLLAQSVIDHFDHDSPIIAEILNYLQVAQPLLYEWVCDQLDQEYIALRNLHRGKDNDTSC